MVDGINEDTAEQDIDFQGIIKDLDTIVVPKTPVLVDLSDQDISLIDCEIPGIAVTGDLVVIFSGDINGDVFFVHDTPIFLLGNGPWLSVLFPDKVFPRLQFGILCFFRAASSTPSMVWKEDWDPNFLGFPNTW